MRRGSFVLSVAVIGAVHGGSVDGSGPATGRHGRARLRGDVAGRCERGHGHRPTGGGQRLR